MATAIKRKITEWEETGRDEGALLSGVPLEVASHWREGRQVELTKLRRSTSLKVCVPRIATRKHSTRP
jgi:hypothetical protein